jgi:endonuclease/exonuclease/phosphatase family metal-dependent hydrolase
VRLRVLTLNVHDPWDGGLDGLAALLDRSGAEVIALTECRKDAAEQFARRLGCAGLVHALAPFWGNALLTRTLPVLAARSVQLPPSRFGEPRSAAVARLGVGDGSALFAATHLDHTAEADRLAQLRHLFEEERLDSTACVLMGDLNALTRADYDEDAWARVASARELAGLPPPVHDLTDWLRGELRFQDAHDARPAGAAFAPTCPYGTRVDYVLLGEHCPLRPVEGTYRVLDAIGPGLTDHDAVSVELSSADA